MKPDIGTVHFFDARKFEAYGVTATRWPDAAPSIRPYLCVGVPSPFSIWVALTTRESHNGVARIEIPREDKSGTVALTSQPTFVDDTRFVYAVPLEAVDALSVRSHDDIRRGMINNTEALLEEIKASLIRDGRRPFKPRPPPKPAP